MKKALYLFSFLALLCIAACEDDTNPYESEGIITGFDPRLCPSPCCGGFFIEIEGTSYLAGELPSDNLDITSETLPLPVYLDWEIIEDNFDCGIERIFVSAIEAQ